MARKGRYRRLLFLTGAGLVLVPGATPAAGVSGTIDRTFGRNGVAVVDLPGHDMAWRLAVQPNGRIVVAGWAGDRVAVLRFLPSGRLDRSFAGDGITTLPLGTYALPVGLGFTRDGGIVVGAVVNTIRTYTGDAVVDPFAQVALDGSRIAIAKLRSNGSLDTAYGRGGIATTQTDDVRPLDEFAVDIAVLPGGEVVALAIRGSSLGWYGYPSAAVLIRFAAGGTLDPTFGAAGIAPVSYVGALPGIASLAVQPDGRIIVGATLHETTYPTGNDLVVARHLPTGALDPTFGPGGVVRIDLAGKSDSLWGVRLQRDGKIVTFGDTVDPGVGFMTAMVRLLPDGSLDPAFGAGGKVTRAYGSASNIHDVVVQPDGSFLLAVFQYGGAVSRSLLVRRRPNGSEDAAFAFRGRREMPVYYVPDIALFGQRVYAVGGRSSSLDAFAVTAFRR